MTILDIEAANFFYQITNWFCYEYFEAKTVAEAASIESVRAVAKKLDFENEKPNLSL